MQQQRFARTLVLGGTLAALAESAFPGTHLRAFRGEAASELQASALNADLVLIDADSAPGPVLARLIQDLAALPQQPAVILLGASPPLTLVRHLLKLSRSDVLETPCRSEDLARAAAPLALKPVATENVCLCWGVMGAVGGAGATTMAVELAANLAGRRDGRKGCLIDLNLADGAAPAYLGVPANMKLDPSVAGPDRIDASLLEVFATPVCEGLDLLASPRDPRAFDIIQSATVMRLLDVAAHKYDWIIIDLPRHRRDWTLDVLSGCDEILIISELTVPALLAARRLSEELEGDLPGQAQPGVVLNRMSSRLLGPAPTVAEAQKALNRKVTGVITSDWESAAKAVNLGGPILHHQPRSKIVRDVGKLVDQLLADKVVEPDTGLRIAG